MRWYKKRGGRVSDDHDARCTMYVVDDGAIQTEAEEEEAARREKRRFAVVTHAHTGLRERHGARWGHWPACFVN